MANDKKSQVTKNKDIDLMSQNTHDDSMSQEISVKHVREEVKNVIERMGCNPKCKGIESETEESTFNESVVQLKIKELTIHGSKAMFDSSQDISQMTAYDVSELSECPKVDTPTEVRQKYFLINAQPSSIDGSYPSTYVLNPSCLVTDQVKQEVPERPSRSRFANWLGSCKTKKDTKKNSEFYTVNIDQPIGDNSPPRRLVFDLVDELPKCDTKTVATNTNTKKNKCLLLPQKKSHGRHEQFVENGVHEHYVKNGVHEHYVKNSVNDGAQKVDVYYFDHGNTEYYRTTDSPPVVMTELLVERTEQYTTRFWAQIFGTIQIGVSFVVSFILQLIRFLLQAIIRPLTVGLIQIISDYFIKPCFTITFNGIIQPILIFLYNLMVSIRDVCQPIADSIGYFIREFAILLKAIRLINVDNSKTIRTCGGNIKEREREKEKEEMCVK